MAKHLPGYEKLPGKARRYRTPSGDTISRREYENRRFQKAGWNSWGDYQRTARDPEYQRFARAYAAKQRSGRAWYQQGKDAKFSSYGKPPPRGQLEPGSEFNEAFLKARKGKFSTRVGGPFDKFLKTVGLRQPDADYQVGDTP